MRRLFCAAIFVIAATCVCFAGEQTQKQTYDGFRGLKWGMTAQEFRGMFPDHKATINTSCETPEMFDKNPCYYVREKEDLEVAGVIFGTIKYYFRNGVLYAIECDEGNRGFDGLLRSITGKYGEPSYKSSAYIVWTTEDTEIKLFRYVKSEFKLSFHQLPQGKRVRKLKDF